MRDDEFDQGLRDRQEIESKALKHLCRAAIALTGKHLSVAACHRLYQAVDQVRLAIDTCLCPQAAREVEFFDPYSIGICHASVCSNLEPEKILERMNLEHPTGTPHEWAISEDECFAGGAPNPCQCTAHEGCKHYLLVC